MAHRIHRDVSIYLEGFDVSGDSNSFTDMRSQETPEDSVFHSVYKRRLAGVQDMSFSLAGFADFEEEAVDEQLHSGFGISSGTPLLWAPDGTVLGDPCFFSQVHQGAYEVGGSFGEVMKFSLSGMLADLAWVRGHLLHPLAGIVAVSSGPAVQLGPQAEDQVFFGHLAVTDFTGMDRIRIQVQSAAAENFANPAFRLSFTAATGVSAMQNSKSGSAVAAGERGHEWFRLSCSTFVATAGAPASEASVVLAAAIV